MDEQSSSPKEPKARKHVLRTTFKEETQSNRLTVLSYNLWMNPLYI